MDTPFPKDALPVWCDRCNCQGYFFPKTIEDPAFIRHEACGFETADVWCEKCGMGGEFVEHLEMRPLTWNCPDCHTTYTLNDDFYHNPYPLILESGMPTPATSLNGPSRFLVSWQIPLSIAIVLFIILLLWWRLRPFIEKAGLF